MISEIDKKKVLAAGKEIMDQLAKEIAGSGCRRLEEFMDLLGVSKSIMPEFTVTLKYELKLLDRD